MFKSFVVTLALLLSSGCGLVKDLSRMDDHTHRMNDLAYQKAEADKKLYVTEKDTELVFAQIANDEATARKGAIVLRGLGWTVKEPK